MEHQSRQRDQEQWRQTDQPAVVPAGMMDGYPAQGPDVAPSFGQETGETGAADGDERDGPVRQLMQDHAWESYHPESDDIPAKQTQYQNPNNREQAGQVTRTECHSRRSGAPAMAPAF